MRGGLSLLIAGCVVAITLGGCGGSDSAGSTESAVQATAPTRGSAEAVLEPIGEDGFSATARFDLEGEALTFTVEGEGFPRTEKNLYTAWLTGSSQDMFSLGTYQVGRDGVLDSEIEISTEAVPFLADGGHDEVVVATTNVTKLEAETAELSEFAQTPRYVGKKLLRGSLSGDLVESGSGS